MNATALNLQINEGDLANTQVSHHEHCITPHWFRCSSAFPRVQRTSSALALTDWFRDTSWFKSTIINGVLHHSPPASLVHRNAMDWLCADLVSGNHSKFAGIVAAARGVGRTTTDRGGRSALLIHVSHSGVRKTLPKPRRQLGRSLSDWELPSTPDVLRISSGNCF